ncbi:MAG: ATP-binding protein [Thermodesulfobacteriota bacterium]
MQDIIIEIVRCIIVLAIFIYLWRVGNRETLSSENGWKFILTGFFLIFLGMLFDITDNFTSLNKFIIIGDTSVESYIEKIFGYFFGFLFLAIGFSKWIPRVIENKQLKKSLQAETEQLKAEIVIRRKEEKLRIETETKLHRSQKMEAIGLMAGSVAHDLNNILSGIVSYPELILLKLPKDHEIVPSVKAIQESGQRASLIISDLLTIARGIATEKIADNLNDIVDEYLLSPEFAKLQSLYPAVKITKNMENSLDNFLCAPVHIRKCIMNLVTNGAEAISSKGNVTVATSNIKIEEPIDAPHLSKGNYVLLSISDDGPGIPETDINNIFEPFFTKKKMGRSGTGLGLAIVWSTIQDHKGDIEVESSNKGTNFNLYFPATDIKKNSHEIADIDLSKLFGNGEKILVVDDEHIQRDIACNYLCKLKYIPVAVKSGEDAIKYTKTNPVHLLIIDMKMDPGINGLATYQSILKKNPNQKAIIASGYAESSLITSAHQLGASQFLKKPYTIAKLGQVVKKALAENS